MKQHLVGTGRTAFGAGLYNTVCTGTGVHFTTLWIGSAHWHHTPGAEGKNEPEVNKRGLKRIGYV